MKKNGLPRGVVCDEPINGCGLIKEMAKKRRTPTERLGRCAMEKRRRMCGCAYYDMVGAAGGYQVLIAGM
jgi:hypothetical protein